MVGYQLRSRDPDGTFVHVEWETEHLPRVGESVMLPLIGHRSYDDERSFQELTVTDIAHYPSRIVVWLGDADDWDPGSVSDLFDRAAAYRAA